MGYQVYKLDSQNRFGGYGVPSICDHPGCNERIDRGMSYCCGGEPFSDAGCGQYFCTDHLGYSLEDDAVQQCERCLEGAAPFPIKPDTRDWIEWQLTDESWSEWRAENPDWVKQHTPRNRWLQWRRYLWVYRHHQGGWCIFILCYGWHWMDGQLAYFGRN